METVYKILPTICGLYKCHRDIVKKKTNQAMLINKNKNWLFCNIN